MPNVIMPFGDKAFPDKILDTFDSYGLHPIMLNVEDILKEPDKCEQGDIIFFDFTRFQSDSDYLSRIKEVFPTLPIVATHIQGEIGYEFFDNLENVIDFIEQPIAVTDICSRLIITWNSYTAVLGKTKVSTSGFLSEQNLIDIIQLFVTGKLTGKAHLLANSKRGIVWVKNGDLIDVQYEDFEPEKALNKLILWDKGTFNIEFSDIDRKKTISEPTSEILENGKKRIQQYFNKLASLPGESNRLFAITEFNESDYTEVELNILHYFKMGKTIASFLSACAIDELEALDRLYELISKKNILLSDLERDEIDEKNRGLGGFINKISNFFKKEEEILKMVEKNNDSTDEIRDKSADSISPRFAKAQLEELISLVIEKL
jgi:hypothetical protein